MISLKLVFASLMKIIMSNLQQHGFLPITKTRKAREVLISKEGGGYLIIRCMFCLLSCIDEPRKNLMQLNQFLMSWFRVQMHGNMLSKFMFFKRKIMNALLFSSWFTWNKSCQFIHSLGMKMYTKVTIIFKESAYRTVIDWKAINITEKICYLF